MKTAQLQQNEITSPGNYRQPGWVWLLLIIICMAMLISGFYGCGNINKATQQVLTSEAAFNKVGANWAKLNPCVVDSTKTLVHDTTIKTDTAFKLLPGTTTVNNVDHYLRDTLVQTVTKTVTLHDSVKIVSVDKRQLGICSDSIAFYKLQFANYKTTAAQQTDEWKHKARVRLWTIIVAIVGVAVYIFRKPLLALITGGASSLLTKI